MKPLFYKFSIPLLLSVFLWLQSCIDDKDDNQPDIVEEGCSEDYTVNSVYQMPSTPIDIDSDSKRDFVLQFKISHYPNDPGKPSYSYCGVGIYPSGDREHNFIYKRLTGGRVPDKQWFGLGDTIRLDSFSPVRNLSDEKPFFAGGRDHHILERPICNGKYFKSWVYTNFERHLDGDVLYMGLHNRITKQLGWLKLGVDNEKGSIEYIDHDYHNDSFVVIGRK